MTKTKRMVCIIFGIFFAIYSLSTIADNGLTSSLIMFALFAYITYWAYKKPIVPSKKELLIQQYPYMHSNFPQIDPSGNKFYRVYVFELTGSHFEKDGKDPQLYVSKISIGAPVLFEHRNVPGFPSAYLATDINGDPLGWLPEHDINRETIVRRLERGLTVLACVNDKTNFKAQGKTYTALIVDIATYDLPKKSKS